MDSTTTTPWHAAFPAPRNTAPDSLSASQVLDLLKQQTSTAKFVLVDLRRNDHEGGTIQGSINLPAQSLYPSIPALYKLFQAAGIDTVIWYCGSSRGRGSRAAGWFSDHIEDRQDAKMKSVILQGGIKGWVAAGEEYTALMDGYEPSKWGEEA
jgi:arsenical-resistance protein 2